MKKYIISILVLIALMNAWAQSKNKLSSYEGRHFIVAFMQNEIDLIPSGNRLELYITSNEKATVTIKGFSGILYNFTMRADTMVKVNFHTDYMLRNSEEISPASIEIESDVPIIIYGLNSIITSSDMFAAIPIANWGNKYMVASYPNDFYRENEDQNWGKIPRCSEFAIVSAYDNTTIKYRPTVNTRLGKPALIEQTIVLNKGDAYLVQSISTPTEGDLSGTIITSDKPIGLFSGHVRTSIPQALQDFDSKDHLVEMMLPVDAWGKNFATSPFVFQEQSEGNLYRVFTMTPNTSVFISTSAGSFEELILEQSGVPYDVENIQVPALWSATAPIQIAQYMKHTGSPLDNGNYDPSLVMIPPIEQFVQKIVFLCPSNPPNNDQQFLSHYASIIAEEECLSTLRADGRLITDFTDIENVKVAGSKYHFARVPIGAGQHTFVCDTGSFSGILYGHGEADSYAVVLGSSLTDPDIDDNNPPKMVVDTVCGNINGYIYEKASNDEVGIDYCFVVTSQTQNYNYNVVGHKDTATVFDFSATLKDPNVEALFTLIARDKNGNFVKLVYKYYPVLFTNSQANLNPVNVSWTDSTCYDFWTKNTSKIPYKLENISCPDSRVKIFTSRPLPTILAVGEQFNYKVCIDPDRDYSAINTNISLEYECDRNFKIPVKLSLIAPEIKSYGHKYGDILVGQDSCQYVYIANTGNTPVVFEKFEFNPSSSAFTYDTLGLLPYRLESGDTLKIRVCFSPDTRMDYTATFTIKNDLNLPNIITVSGKGISPELGDLTYDWLNRRVQSQNSYVFTLKNNGNALAKLKFYNVVTDDASFDITQFKALDVTLTGGSTHQFECYYTPLNTNSHYLLAYFTVNDNVNNLYKLELKGQGSLPTIEVRDHEFPTIDVFTEKDSTFGIVISGGNEELSIESIKIISGDAASFVLDLSVFNNIKIKPDSLMKLPVKFAPKFVGIHKINLEVTNDAAPNYVQVKSQFSITGNSIPVDTNAVEIGCKGESILTACNTYIVYPFVVNQGNTNLTLNKLEFTTVNLPSAKWLVPLMPDTDFAPGDSLIYQVEFTPTAQNPIGKIDFAATISDTIFREYSHNYTTDIKKLNLVHISDFNFIPGDTISLDFDGKFPHQTDMPVGLEFMIGLKEVNFSLLNTNAEIIIQKNNQETKIPLVLEQKNNYIKFLIKPEIVLEFSDVLWKLNLRFVTYLSSIKTSKVTVEFSSSECFYSAVDTTNAELLGVCVYEGRPIQFIEFPIIKKAIYNSFTDAFDFDLELFKQDKISISMYNYSGQIVSQGLNKAMEAGNQILSLDMKDISNGIYIISFKCNYYVKNLVFIKNK